MAQITHVFVLMLENRSFDNLLGFSGITGTDAATGLPTSIDGLTGSESNSYNGVTYTVQRGAPDRARLGGRGRQLLLGEDGQGRSAGEGRRCEAEVTTKGTKDTKKKKRRGENRIRSVEGAAAQSESAHT